MNWSLANHLSTNYKILLLCKRQLEESLRGTIKVPLINQTENKPH